LVEEENKKFKLGELISDVADEETAFRQRQLADVSGQNFGRRTSWRLVLAIVRGILSVQHLDSGSPLVAE
jgi:hypothetical protein